MVTFNIYTTDLVRLLLSNHVINAPKPKIFTTDDISPSNTGIKPMKPKISIPIRNSCIVVRSFLVKIICPTQRAIPIFPSTNAIVTAKPTKGNNGITTKLTARKIISKITANKPPKPHSPH